MQGVVHWYIVCEFVLDCKGVKRYWHQMHAMNGTQREGLYQICARESVPSAACACLCLARLEVTYCCVSLCLTSLAVQHGTAVALGTNGAVQKRHSLALCVCH